MFNNIGNKLRGVAIFFAVVAVIALGAGVICLPFAIEDFEILIFALPCIGGGVFMLIGAWPIYALGQVANDVRYIRDHFVLNSDKNNNEHIIYGAKFEDRKSTSNNNNESANDYINKINELYR